MKWDKGKTQVQKSNLEHPRGVMQVVQKLQPVEPTMQKYTAAKSGFNEANRGYPPDVLASRNNAEVDQIL